MLCEEKHLVQKGRKEWEARKDPWSRFYIFRGQFCPDFDPEKSLDLLKSKYLVHCNFCWQYIGIIRQNALLLVELFANKKKSR